MRNERFFDPRTIFDLVNSGSTPCNSKVKSFILWIQGKGFNQDMFF
ncbi:unnamed protein product [Spirodela intermedia]|uniref:Uncharacterized protein n=1 Tax=Spirodela intermedia TaxID=51605 RepID=A0A7I8JDV6_SPIIN|nr:unnamed protein product [Spirodela intermedia]CAA6668326.1 unnamed protein product [Spirodela intermedia]